MPTEYDATEFVDADFQAQKATQTAASALAAFFSALPRVRK
jgi:hypothetical protein